MEQYRDWMKGLLTILPDGRYELKSFAADEERNNVIAYAVFSGTHTGEGGPVAADREKREGGLRLCHGLPGRPYSPHDEDLAFRDHPEATRLGLRRSSVRLPAAPESSTLRGSVFTETRGAPRLERWRVDRNPSRRNAQR